MTDRELMQQALEALELHAEQYPHMQKGYTMDAITALRDRLAQPEPVQCEPQDAVTEDGWCDWVCPKPTGYLMQCCDCGLIHEVDSRVAKYEPCPSEMFEVVNDPDLQVQWRMKRRDDISPKQPRQWQGLTDDEIEHIADSEWEEAFVRMIEAKLKERNG